MNSLIDSALKSYCFALNSGISKSFVFAEVSIFVSKSIILKLTVLAEVLRLDPSYRTQHIIVFS